MNGYRAGAAVVATICWLPCLGQSVYGTLASQEPPGSIAFAVLWASCGVIPLIGVVMLWVWAFRPTRRSGHCEACGYNLAGRAGRICPECGVTVTR